MSRITIVGSGVVGRATGKGFIEHGNSVTFVDVDEVTINRLSEEGYVAVYPSDVDLDGVDAVFVSVSAPTVPYGVDLSYLEQACKSLGMALTECRTRPVIVFRCTMPPGTTRDFLIPLLEAASGKKPGEDFGVCYNPEEAEFQKYVHNLFNATKISFFNEMRIAAEILGVDPQIAFQFTALSAQGMWDALYGARDDGPFGGACLPKDVNAWLSFAKSKGLPAALLGAVREVNRACGGS